MKQTVVLIHPGSLGDVLLAVPAIRRLRVTHSQHDLVLIACPSVSRFLWRCHEVDHWMSIEDGDCVGLFVGSAHISGRAQFWLTRCHLAVAWIEDKEGILSHVLEECGVRKKHIQSPFSPTLKQQHQSHRFLESIGEATENSAVDGIVQVHEEMVEQAKAYLELHAIPLEQPVVLIHPGSGSVHKCMKPEVMASLVQRLQHSGMYPLILEGPADQDVVAHMLREIRTKPPVLKRLELSLLAGILTQMDLYIGHDSGVTHLAASLGVKTLAIFGPTDYRRWAPLGNHVTVVKGPPCTCLSWDSVRQCAHKACLDIPIEWLVLEERGLPVKL